jgi:hypothetical protein
MNESASMIVGVYVHHLFALAKAVRDGCDQVFADAPIPPSDGYIKVNPGLHSRIDGILIDAANLKKLIKTPAERGKSESQRTFRFRRQRTEALTEFLRGLSLEAISDVQVRNSLEHFDEYLDQLGAKLEDGEQPPKPAAAYNIVFSSWNVARAVAQREVYPLRVYVADERTYFNFDRRINLGMLREEAAAITQRIEATGELHNEPGGLMVLFPVRQE